METIYRAFDGTEFHDEDECLDYEKKEELKDLKDCILLDGNKNPVLEPEVVMYAYFKNEEQLLTFNRLCKKDGVAEIKTYDTDYELVFFYDMFTDEYVQYQERLNDFKLKTLNLKNEMEEIKNAIL